MDLWDKLFQALSLIFNTLTVSCQLDALSKLSRIMKIYRILIIHIKNKVPRIGWYHRPNYGSQGRFVEH